jgi:hypothetical protein
METYIDISLAIFLQIYAFYDSGNLDAFFNTYLTTFTEIFNASLTFLIALALIYLPIIMITITRSVFAHNSLKNKEI